MKGKPFLCLYGMRSIVQPVVCSLGIRWPAQPDYWPCVVVPITPSRTWSQTPASVSGAPPSLLGLSMRLCTPESALENVWHILEVLEGSPAESAGLVPYGDWVLGWAGGVLASESDFYEVVESHIDKPLRVYVYSYDFECVHCYYAHPFTNRFVLARFAKLFLFQIGSGEGKDSLVVALATDSCIEYLRNLPILGISRLY